MKIHYIDEDNFTEAIQAIRDILFLYHDAITGYRGFGHNLHTGTFDPFRYVTALLAEPPGVSLAIDIELIHEGSAVALLCHLSDYWDETSGESIESGHFAGRIKKELSDGVFDFVPLAKEAVEAAFENETKFQNCLQKVYIEYIEGYYRTILQESL